MSAHKTWAVHDGGKFGLYGDDGPTVCEENGDGTCQPLFQLIGPAGVDGCKRVAFLAAAAPELLAALEWYVDNDDTAEGMPGNEPWDAVRDAARAVIYKAEGRQ